MGKEAAQANFQWPPGGTFITMCQLVPLSIMVKLEDTVFWGQRVGVGGGGGVDHRPLVIVNGLNVTLTRIITHTHTMLGCWVGGGWGWGWGLVMGQNYTGREDNKWRRLRKVNKQSRTGTTQAV